MQRKNFMKSLLVAAPLIAFLAMPEAGIASGGLANATLPSGPLMTPEQQYYAYLDSVTRSTVPLKVAVRPNGQSDNLRQPTSDNCIINYNIDKNGFVSQFKVLQTSNSKATDFWALWAAVSCAPIKPFEPAGKSNFPMSISVSENFDGTAVEPHHQARIALEVAISQKANAKYIYFPLIPATFIETYTNYLPWHITLPEVWREENLVGIPLELLTSSGSQKWSAKSANELINAHGQVGDLLREWPQFFREHPKPSREEIFSFANSLKVKYRNILKV